MPESQRPGEARLDLHGTRRARVFRVLEDSQWWFIGGAAVTAFVLGLVGFRAYQHATGGPTGFWDVAYRSLQLFTLESGALTEGDSIPPSLQVARFLAPLVMAGAVVRAVVSLFREQAQLLRIRLTKDHVVVGGVGRKGLALVRSLHEQGHQVVAIDQDAESDTAAAARAAGVPVLVGDATDPEVLRKAGLDRAGFLVALCGQSGANAQIATVAHELSHRRKRPLTCLAHVIEPELCTLLRARFPTSGSGGMFRLEFFDIYERAARVLLQRHPPFGDSDHDIHVRPHVLVIGFGRLGRRVVLQAARNWRTGQHASDRRFLVTVVDPLATEKVEAFLEQHPELRSACDIDVTTELGAALGAEITVTFVCIGDEVQALLTGLTVHAALQDPSSPVVVRARTDEGLPTLLSTAEGGFSGLRGFAVLDETCDGELLFGGFNESLAQLLHARYVSARESQGWTFGPHRDPVRRTQPALAPWPELAPELKESNRDQAAHTWAKLAEVGCELAELTDWDAPRFTFTDDQVELLAASEHRRWMERQRETARRRWFSPSRAPHPDLVDWASLPEEEREIDRQFVRALPAVLAQLGYQVTPRPGPRRTS